MRSPRRYRQDRRLRRRRADDVNLDNPHAIQRSLAGVGGDLATVFLLMVGFDVETSNQLIELLGEWSGEINQLKSRDF